MEECKQCYICGKQIDPKQNAKHFNDDNIEESRYYNDSDMEMCIKCWYESEER